jgi:histidinol-phosphatase (PHP family)
VISNYHTHTTYCDGKNTIREIVEHALSLGMASIGFSSHAPLPFDRPWCMKRNRLPDYLGEIDQLKKELTGIEIYKGLEIDYIPTVISPDQFSSQLDYTIGSIHFVNSLPDGTPWEIDSTLQVFETGLKEVYQGDIKSVIHDYFDLTRAMIVKSKPTIVGHMDKIKIHNSNNRFYDENEPWYKKEILETLQAIRLHGSIVEVNTRGLYMNKTKDPYPGEWILREIKKLNIPITLNSDAHHSKDLIARFDTTTKLLQEIGFKSRMVLRKSVWQESALF